VTKLDVFIAGVGGQGSLTASTLLGRAAARAGIKVVVGEIHGMAQRGGVVTSTVRLGDVYGPIISAGRADVLLGFEPIETWRSLAVASDQTLVITDTHPIEPASGAPAVAPYPAVKEALSALDAACGKVIALDATAVATELGNARAVNSLLLGVLAGTGVLPFEAAVLAKVIEEGVPLAAREVNAQAFARGQDLARDFLS
jgi:indolepyruvate ferredoxin oxidoreductase beta subunit